MIKHKFATIVALLAFIGAGFLAAGCGSDPPRAVQLVKRQQAKPGLAAPGRPGAVVAKLWRYVSSGAIPAAVMLYEPRVRQAVGITNLAGGLGTEQEGSAGARFSLVDQTASPAGPLISVQIRRRDGALSNHVYVMRRTPQGFWRIGYDTLMVLAIRAYVASPSGGAFTAQTRSDAARAVAAFRTALFDSSGELRKPPKKARKSEARAARKGAAGAPPKSAAGTSPPSGAQRAPAVRPPAVPATPQGTPPE